MLKDHLRRHGLLSPAEALSNSEQKAKLLQDVTDQQRSRLIQLEALRDNFDQTKAKMKAKF